MRPQQIKAARERRLAWLPAGCIEWHGWHAPQGLDGLRAHGLCVQAAREFGGLVYPPMWYGEPRCMQLADANPNVRAQIADAMDCPGPVPGMNPAQAATLTGGLLGHVYQQILESGAHAVYVVVGHGPLLAYAALVADIAERRTGKCFRVDLINAMLAETNYPDHGGASETWSMAALDPDVVSIEEAKGANPDIGLAGMDPRGYGSSVWGEELNRRCVKVMAGRAADLMARQPFDGGLHGWKE